MELKKLEQTEIEEALSLVLNVFMEFEAPDYSKQGVATFKQFLKDKDAISALNFYGTGEENVLTGVIAMRNSNHISLLFVRKEYHRRGIAKALFEHML